MASGGAVGRGAAGRRFCVKMRASAGGAHVSGAERIASGDAVPKVVAALARRALGHEKGVPDFINLKVEAAGEPLRVPALKVATEIVANADEGWRKVSELLASAGFSRVAEIRELFREAYSMRGAMLLDADTLERLEPDLSRGVRATYMDAADGCVAAGTKDHYAEAIVLASKVQCAPGIVGEICMSDDPGYVTGYVATKELGYRRITVLKEKGDPSGGRIFLYRGRREDVSETIRFLEKTPVLVTDVPALAPDGEERRFASIAAELERVREDGLWRRCVETVGATGPTAMRGGRELAVLASNDYLDLARDGRVVAAAADAARKWGAGSGGSRLVTGTQSPAIVYSTGYMANVGAISALVGRGDVVFSDALNHASIIDGCRMSGADVEVYRHLDMDDLGARLARARCCRRRLVVSDAVFSMDGDMLDLPRFLEVCRRHDAFSMIDEAHSLGVVGRTGRGLCEHFECTPPDVLVGTLSKALGSQGGYVCGGAEIVEYLRQKSRPFIFNTAPCAAAVAAADAALSVLEAEPWRVERLRGNVRFFVDELVRHGVAARTDSAIVPVVVGDETQAVEVSAALEREGFLVTALRDPTVARGAARLRVALRSAHERPMLAAAAEAIARLVS